jgi:hypothetical protein
LLGDRDEFLHGSSFPYVSRALVHAVLTHENTDYASCEPRAALLQYLQQSTGLARAACEETT